MGAPLLIYCADGNREFASAAVEAGWLYGARLPATVYQWPYFADQDWKAPNREAYMKALAYHKPVMATVLDWERADQLPEVLSWAEEVATSVRESVVIIPKVVGGVPMIPRTIGTRRVVLAYSIPTSYGGSPLSIWEFAGWPVHLLGGSPQKQMWLADQMGKVCEVVSADGNMAGQQARQGRTWRPDRIRRSHWWQLREVGDDRKKDVPLECFKRSLATIKDHWERPNLGVQPKSLPTSRRMRGVD